MAAGGKYYMTPAGYAALRREFEDLVRVARPQLVQVVAWAASNGDRSENGDYIYGKKKLREMDRRIRYLTRRIEDAVVVDPAQRAQTDQVFFGARVTVVDVDDASLAETTWRIVGVDEADPGGGDINWLSPLAKALMKARIGDEVSFHTPSGVRRLEIVAISYD